MFATPASAASHEPSLASRVFGRWAGQRTPVGTVPVASMSASPQVAAADDENVPDLAQRVREVGEW